MNVESIRQYAFPVLDSNMFICCSGVEALVIDPHVSDEALEYLKRQGTQKVLILLTHEHYDHTSGVTWLAEIFPAVVVCQRLTAESLRLGKNNRPIVMAAKCMQDADTERAKTRMRALPRGYKYEADVVFDRKLCISWQGNRIHFVYTPGHSPGSCCIELGDDMVATGDSLIHRTPVITRFPGGNSGDFFEMTVPYLQALRKDALILPGHGKCFRFSLEELEKCRPEKWRS